MFENYYFAFLDVLGFKEKVKDFENENQDSSELVKFYTNDCRDYIKRLLKLNDKEHIQFQIFSDSIILYCKVDLDIYKPKKLSNLLIAIAKIQNFMSSRGFWLRGGLSKGKLYIDEKTNVLLGSALIKAYELEDKYAVTPRVILDLDFYSIYGGRNNFVEVINSYVVGKAYSSWKGEVLCEPFGYPLSNIHIHEDNLVFINFFNDYLVSADNSKRLLEASDILLKEIYSSPKVYDKLMWLKMYLESGSNMVYENIDEDVNKIMRQAYQLLNKNS